jgi:hypothetical protein
MKNWRGLASRYDNRGAPPERLVRQRAGDAVTRGAFASAPSAPPVGLQDAAREDRPVGLEPLPSPPQDRARRAGRTWSGQGRRM